VVHECVSVVKMVTLDDEALLLQPKYFFMRCEHVSEMVYLEIRIGYGYIFVKHVYT